MLIARVFYHVLLWLIIVSVVKRSYHIMLKNIYLVKLVHGLFLSLKS